MTHDTVETFHAALSAEAHALDVLSRRVLPDAVISDALTVLMYSPVVCVTGMGKSGHVARKVAATMSSLGTRAVFVHPAEAAHGDLGMIGESDAVLAFSWSGDTIELAPILEKCQSIVGVTSRRDSALGRASRVVLELPRLSEACINGQAPTVSTTMQLAVGDALAVALSRARGFTPDQFRALHPGGALGASK